MAFSLKAMILCALLIVVGCAFLYNQLFLSPIKIATCTPFFVCIAAPSAIFTMNLKRTREENTIRMYVFAAGLIIAHAGCVALHCIIEAGIVDEDSLSFWSEVVKATSILCLFPLHLTVLRWKVDVVDQEDSQFKLGLFGNFDVQVKLVEGSLAATTLRNAEIRRSLFCAFTHFYLIISAVGVVAAILEVFGQEVAETTVAFLSLASTISLWHSVYRYLFLVLYYDDEDLPYTTVIRSTARLFLVIIPAVLTALGWLYARDVIDLKDLAHGLNHFRQPACMLFSQFIMPQEIRRA